MTNPIKNNKGAALAAVIIAMIVLTLLGSAVLKLAYSESTTSITNEKDNQAEYIAKSGAEIAARYVSDNQNSSITSLTDSLGEGSFYAAVSWINSSTVRIDSAGTVDSSTKNVSLVLAKMTYSDLFTGMRQTGTDDLDLSAMNIEHDPGTVVQIEANVMGLDHITLSSSDAADSDIVKSINNETPPIFELPDYAGYQTTLPAYDAATMTMTLTGNYYVPSLVKGNNQYIVFDTQGTDQYIIVNTLTLTGPQGNVRVIGGGSVHLFILDSGDIQTPVSVNNTTDGVLFIYVADGKSLSISANGTVDAYIYAPKATVEIQSALTTVKGAIIGEIINRGNVNGAKGTFYYVPLSQEPDDNPIKLNLKKVMYLK